MKKFNQWLESITAKTLALLMMLIVLTVLWQVFSRYVLKSPSSVSEEIARFLLIWLGLLGSTYGYQQNAHLSLDILARKFRPSGQLKLARFCHVCILIFSVSFLLVGGVNLVLTTLQPVQTSAVLEIKMAYIYCIMPIAGLMFAVSAIDKILTTSVEQFESAKSGAA